MMTSSANAETEANLALIDELKFQEDVRMFSQLPDYNDYQVFDLAKEDYLATASKRANGAFLNRRGKSLNAIYLTYKYRIGYPGK